MKIYMGFKSIWERFWCISCRRFFFTSNEAAESLFSSEGTSPLWNDRRGERWEAQLLDLRALEKDHHQALALPSLLVAFPSLLLCWIFSFRDFGLTLFLSLSLFLSYFLSLFLSYFLSLFLSLSLFFFLSFSLSLSLSLFLSFSLSYLWTLFFSLFVSFFLCFSVKTPCRSLFLSFKKRIFFLLERERENFLTLTIPGCIHRLKKNTPTASNKSSQWPPIHWT